MEMRKHNLGNLLSPSMKRSIRSVRIVSEPVVIERLENEITVSANVIAVICGVISGFMGGFMGLYMHLRKHGASDGE
jgi:hypothetical protein